MCGRQGQCGLPSPRASRCPGPSLGQAEEAEPPGLAGGGGCAFPNSKRRAVPEGSFGEGFLLGCADCGGEQGAGACSILGVGFSSSVSRPRPWSGPGDSDTAPKEVQGRAGFGDARPV